VARGAYGINRNWELSQLGDGATRSRIEDGWHPNWERTRRKEKGRTMKIREHSGILSISRAMQKKFCGSDFVER